MYEEAKEIDRPDGDIGCQQLFYLKVDQFSIDIFHSKGNIVHETIRSWDQQYDLD